MAFLMFNGQVDYGATTTAGGLPDFLCGLPIVVEVEVAAPEEEACKEEPVEEEPCREEYAEPVVLFPQFSLGEESVLAAGRWPAGFV
jgi:hypothetical protein